MTFWKTYDSKMKSLKIEGGIVKDLDRSEAKVLVSEFYILVSDFVPVRLPPSS